MSSVAVNVCSACGYEMVESGSLCPHCRAAVEAAAQPERTVDTPAGEVVCAAVWRRLLAAIFDLFLASALLFPIAIVMMWVMEAYHSQIGLNEFKSRATMGTAVVLLWIVWFWIYSAAAESSVQQATPGKRLFHLKVANANGERISFYQATCRYFAKFFSTFGLLIGFAMAVFHHRRLSLHDMIAGTVVIRSK